MLTKESIYIILYAIPIYQLLFYTVQLISFKRRNPSKKYLGLLLLSMTAFLVFNAMHFLGYDELFSYVYFIYLPVLLGITPAYFLYILSITQENHDVKKRQRFVLFSPAIIFLIVNLVILGSMDQSARMSLIQHDIFSQGTLGIEIPGLLLVFWIGAILLIFAQISFAIIKVIQIIQSETNLMRKQPSHLAYLEWPWILGISLSVLIFLVINALIEMVVPMQNIGIVLVYNLLMLLAGGLTGYLGMKQDDLLNQVEKIISVQETPGRQLSDSNSEEEKLNVSSEFISDYEAEQIHKMILDYLHKDKPYVKSDFSMHDLCNHLKISRRKVSYVLNEVIQKNFYGVINELRINDAEELLTREELSQMKIEVLGEMVGFQSKSSFNACFKKVTGMTPSEYRLVKKSKPLASSYKPQAISNNPEA